MNKLFQLMWLILPIFVFGQEPKIVFMSGHYPLDTYYAQETRKTFEEYTARHGYGFYLFHERPWPYPVNTGVKIVNRDALELEEEVWSLRNTEPWCQFPADLSFTIRMC